MDLSDFPLEIFQSLLLLVGKTSVITMFVCRRWKELVTKMSITKKADFTNAAAKSGYQNLLIWARSNGCQWTESTIAFAAKGGHFEIVKWLKANNCPWDSDTYQFALKKRHHNICQWAYDNFCPNVKSRPCPQCQHQHYRSQYTSRRALDEPMEYILQCVRCSRFRM